MKRRKTKKIIPCVLSGMMMLSGFTQYVYADEVENEPVMSDSFVNNQTQITENGVTNTTVDESTVVIEETPSTNVEVRDDSSTAGTDSTESNETTTDSPLGDESNKNDNSSLESSESKEDTSKKDETSDVDTNQDGKHDGIENGTTSSENKDSNQNNDENREDDPKLPEVENKAQEESNSNTLNINSENKIEQNDQKKNQNNVTKYSPVTAVPSSSTVHYGYNDSYVDTWYHPTLINALGYTGEVKNAIKLNDYVTGNWNQFTIASNPFQRGQCTYFAWSRFYQVY